MKSNKILSYHPIHTDLGILLFRLIFGGLFMYYGYSKVSNYEAINSQFPDIIGIGASLSFNLVIFAELICGFFVAIGLLTRLSIIPIFFTMIVAYFIAHANDPFTVKQTSFIYLVLSVVIFIFGSGKFSVDSLIFKDKN